MKTKTCAYISRAMETPPKLYRYRPLEDGLLDRELGALRDSYLYAPPFAAMNDPMEAFYETGGPGDRIINAMLAPAGKHIDGMYGMLSEMIDRFALVSFAGTYEDLPMWAYYGSNFGGMCLEFDTAELAIGDFQSEKLRPVTYARDALPPLTMTDMAPECLEEAVIARITRKRAEWAHEKEWRFIAGEIGPKHYLDDALRRVFLGPRVKPEHAARVCEILDRRPVEVLQGEIRGFELRFRSIKPARPMDECERVGAGRFEPQDIIYKQDELEAFVGGALDALLDECRRTALRPNLEEIADFNVSGNRKGALFIWAIYKLRSGRDVYHKRYFDRQMRYLPEND
ncbi:hypothetical protein M2336_001053 [Sphingobium sp. B1D7B]|nr:hypothetical protein [Sphingobium sp. B1D7B]